MLFIIIILVPCINNVYLPYLTSVMCLNGFRQYDFLWLSIVCVKTMYRAIKKYSKCHAYCSITKVYEKRVAI